MTKTQTPEAKTCGCVRNVKDTGWLYCDDCYKQIMESYAKEIAEELKKKEGA